MADSNFTVHNGVDIAKDKYALGITGALMSPDLDDGDLAIFDPTEEPQKGDIVAVWFKGVDKPSVTKLYMALPPKCLWDGHPEDEVEAMLVCEQTNPKKIRSAPINKVSMVHKMIDKEAAHA